MTATNDVNHEPPAPEPADTPPGIGGLAWVLQWALVLCLPLLLVACLGQYLVTGTITLAPFLWIGGIAGIASLGALLDRLRD